MILFQLSAELFVLFLMLYSPAMANGRSVCCFLGRIPAGKRQYVQKMTVIQAKAFLFFNNFLPYISPPLNQWPLVFSWQLGSGTKQAVCCMKHNILLPNQPGR